MLDTKRFLTTIPNAVYVTSVKNEGCDISFNDHIGRIISIYIAQIFI